MLLASSIDFHWGRACVASIHCYYSLNGNGGVVVADDVVAAAADGADGGDDDAGDYSV